MEEEELDSKVKSRHAAKQVRKKREQNLTTAAMIPNQHTHDDFTLGRR